MGLGPLACRDCGFGYRWDHGCHWIVNVVCCQVEVSAPGWSPDQRSPNECGVTECDQVTSQIRKGELGTLVLCNCDKGSYRLLKKHVLIVWCLLNCERLFYAISTHKRWSVKVKQSHYRPYMPWGFQEVEVPRFSRQSTHEGGKVFSPSYRPALSPRKYSWYSFLLEAESTPGP